MAARSSCKSQENRKNYHRNSMGNYFYSHLFTKLQKHKFASDWGTGLKYCSEQTRIIIL